MSITVISSSIRNGRLNVLGDRDDLVFDKDGVCEDVPFDLALLVAPQHGMKVTGLTAEQKAQVVARIEKINEQRHNELHTGKVRVRGVGTNPKSPEGTVVVQTAIAAGRLPRSAQQAAQPADATGRVKFQEQVVEKSMEEREQEAAAAKAPEPAQESKPKLKKKSKAN